jgi:hypothetical protein
MSTNFTLLSLRERHVIQWGCINTYLRSQVCSIHSLAYKTFFIKWLGEDICKLIFGAHILYANVCFLLMISFEMMANIYMLCSLVLDWIVGELHGTLIVT